MSVPSRVILRPTSAARANRPRTLPAVGMPTRRQGRGGAVVSLLVHLLLIALIATPIAVHHEIIERPQGAGGPGPAGGGGGGRGGTGGRTPEMRERLQYVVVAPQPTPPPVPAVVPPKPVVPPPPPVKPPEMPKVTPPEAKPIEPMPQPAKVGDAAPVAGTGGGTGRDGSSGTGPGSGGGTGSGVGTGRGSGVGPGTGGGTQANYPPTPTEVFLPPFPMPARVHGFHLVAEYDIDELGRIVGLDFTHTGDRDYDKRLDQVLRSFHFRPGTRPDGVPIRMKAQIVYDF